MSTLTLKVHEHLTRLRSHDNIETNTAYMLILPHTAIHTQPFTTFLPPRCIGNEDMTMKYHEWVGQLIAFDHQHHHRPW